ncbi:MAG: alpha/beta hydrolase [Acholeplasmataceae bacterium]|nr:alpha/beta hydrolase [Acholeplasmataceae bacterium]
MKFGKVAYYLSGRGKTLVFLHGWGQNFLSFNKITEELKNDYQILGIDLPGFGMSDEPEYPLGLNDYVDTVEKILEHLSLKEPIIIAHSFGGRVAIRYSITRPTKVLILVSSAGIKRRSISLGLKIFCYKVLKRIYRIIARKKYFHLINHSGSDDYVQATPIMKQTMSHIISVDLRKDLRKIKIPTHLLWGVYDEATPYRDALLMHKLISHSQLHPFYRSGHFCYLTEGRKFINTLKRILSEDLYGNIQKHNGILFDSDERFDHHYPNQ